MLLYLFRKRSRNNNDSCCKISDTLRFEQKIRRSYKCVAGTCESSVAVLFSHRRRCLSPSRPHSTSEISI